VLEPGAAPEPSPEPSVLELTHDAEPWGPGRASFPFDVAFPADDPNAVVVRYGDSSSCPRRDVDVEVHEAAFDVMVTLVAARLDGGPCTEDYAARDVTVPLDAPLGDRVVVDGFDATERAVASGTPPGPPGSPVPLPPR
jgi:hypothetical protein